MGTYTEHTHECHSKQEELFPQPSFTSAGVGFLLSVKSITVAGIVPHIALFDHQPAQVFPLDKTMHHRAIIAVYVHHLTFGVIAANQRL